MARPGDLTSPFNQVVDKTKVHPRSTAKLDGLAKFGSMPMNMVIWDRQASGKSSAHALCVASASDPEYTIRQEQSWFPANTGQKLRIPVQAEAGLDGYDYQLSVKQPDGSTWEFGRFERRGDARTYTPRSKSGGDVWCNCVGRGNPQTLVSGYGEATQGHFDLAAGQITGEEMKADRISHALFMVVPGSARSGYFINPVPEMSGKPRPPSPGYTDKIEVGQRIFLNLSAIKINALPIKPWEKVIYRAMSRYGMIVGDGGGSGMFSIEPLSGSSYVPFGKPDPWVEYAKTQTSVYNGSYSLKWTPGVIDWRTQLRVAG